ncbi:MAG: hypothetical protein H6837_12895 [Planctomycetes bacterium]|nr:hypothetical protein [Planctomycetota bacterium]
MQVSGRQRPDAFEGDDVNWLQALVDVRAGGFAGAVSCSLRNDDLADFRDALAGLTDGRREVARFRTMEDQLG